MLFFFKGLFGLMVLIQKLVLKRGGDDEAIEKMVLSYIMFKEHIDKAKSKRVQLSFCGVVCTVIFMSNPTTVLRLCCRWGCDKNTDQLPKFSFVFFKS